MKIADVTLIAGTVIEAGTAYPNPGAREADAWAGVGDTTCGVLVPAAAGGGWGACCWEATAIPIAVAPPAVKTAAAAKAIVPRRPPGVSTARMRVAMT
ncbi:hypothetical protein GCM10027176_51270 [Actinoallomurus bryophytorum]